MVASKSLPPGCILRPACSEDLGTIRKLVFQAKLDPTQLRWENFSVIEFQAKLTNLERVNPNCRGDSGIASENKIIPNGRGDSGIASQNKIIPNGRGDSGIASPNKIIACGQLRQFSGCQELGSLVVDKSWRDRGLGSYLVQNLVEEATAPVYVECMGWLVEFYEQLGFVKIAWKDLPKPLKIKFFLGQLGSKVLPLKVTILQANPFKKH